MSFINYSSREINCKIVYYGPGLCGKTTNLQHIYQKTNPDVKGKMISLATETERTLFFDFLPLSLGEIRGFKTRFHLYTVPGQVFYDASRKLILKGVDGVVFVADSQMERMEANIESMQNLYDNMAFGLRLRKTPEDEIKRRVMDAARLLRIDHMLDRKPAALSGGQRQRVAIGRAIVRQPKVFLFDEPLSNLDAQLRNEMRSEIKKLHQRLGATIIYVTHDQVEAMTLADRIAVLSAGHKMQFATPDEIYNRPAAHFVAGFTGSPPMNLVPCVVQAHSADLGGVQIALAPDLVQRAAQAKAHVFGIRPENVTLAPRVAEGEVSVPATVVISEPLGAETLVTFQVGQVEWVVRCPASFKVQPGTTHTLYLHTASMHLFDKESGQAL